MAHRICIGSSGDWQHSQQPRAQKIKRFTWEIKFSDHSIQPLNYHKKEISLSYHLTHFSLRTTSSAFIWACSLLTISSAIFESSSFCRSRASWIRCCSIACCSANCFWSCSMRRWACAINEFSSSSDRCPLQTSKIYYHKLNWTCMNKK